MMQNKDVILCVLFFFLKRICVDQLIATSGFGCRLRSDLCI